MHRKNPHFKKYDLNRLATFVPQLKELIIKNKKGEPSINFSDPKSVSLLNEALLKAHHGIEIWDSNTENLTPAVPGRCDHLLYMRDFLKNQKIILHLKINVLDIGTGASCIYPIVGTSMLDWHFVASEAHEDSYKAACKVVKDNPERMAKVEIRRQADKSKIFTNIIKPDEKFMLTICNPPFFKSIEDSQKETYRKNKNLRISKTNKKNFGGLSHEIWYPGGEFEFIKTMIDESVLFKTQVRWFSSLVAKEDNLKKLIRYINKKKKIKHHVVEFKHGNKTSRILAWQPR